MNSPECCPNIKNSQVMIKINVIGHKVLIDSGLSLSLLNNVCCDSVCDTKQGSVK